METMDYTKLNKSLKKLRKLVKQLEALEPVLEAQAAGDIPPSSTGTLLLGDLAMATHHFLQHLPDSFLSQHAPVQHAAMQHAFGQKTYSPNAYSQNGKAMSAVGGTATVVADSWSEEHLKRLSADLASRLSLDLAHLVHLTPLAQTTATSTAPAPDAALYADSAELQRLSDLSLVASKTDNAVIITDKDGGIEWVNDGFVRVTGYSLSDVLGKKPGSFLQGELTDRKTVDAIRAALDAKKGFQGEIYNYGKAGNGYWLALSITPVFDEYGNLKKFIAIESDVTHQKAAEQRLTDLSLVASKTDNAVIITDKDGGIEWVNDGFVRVTGYSLSDVLGKKPGSFLQGELTDRKTVDAIRAALDAKQKFEGEIYNYGKAGNGYWLALAITPVLNEAGEVEKFIAIESDVTSRKKAEQELRETQLQLMQAEKMSSLGQMVAGVAHEINTPLGFVRSNLELLQESTDETRSLIALYTDLRNQILHGSPDKVAATLEGIDALLPKFGAGSLYEQAERICDNSVEGIDRIQELVMNLKNFSRLDESTFKPVDINASMESTLKIAAHILKNKVEVVRDYAKVPEVHGYPAQLNQVFLNLITNAAQAVEARHKNASGGTTGTLMVRTLSRPGKVVVKVIDNGTGIAPEHLEKIFNPFFTTKDVGKGTGLGLSIAFKIVEKHRGKIYVASTPGKGTEFTVELPTGDAASLSPLAASPFTESVAGTVEHQSQSPFPERVLSERALSESPFMESPFTVNAFTQHSAEHAETQSAESPKSGKPRKGTKGTKDAKMKAL